MKGFAAAALVALFASIAAYAANPACETQANEKKLADASRNSFLTKGESYAKAAVTQSCEAQATEKKLAGAARTIFTKKCVTDATAAAK